MTMKRPALFFLVLACSVLAATNARAQTLHTAHDHIPDFAATPTIRSASSGSWSSASTWTPARVPSSSDVIRIAHTVTFDSASGDADVIGIDAGGTLRFATDRNTRLRIGTLIVLPNGSLEIGTPPSPVGESVVAEIVIKDKPLDLGTDPDQFGTGLISVDGKVTMHGAEKTPTFVRVALEPRAGDGSVTLERAVSGWRVGDRVFLPDTRQTRPENWFDPTYALHVEERIVQNLAADGQTLSLSSPLSYDHLELGTRTALRQS